MQQSKSRYYRVACKKCGKKISKSNIRKHEKNCSPAPTTSLQNPNRRSAVGRGNLPLPLADEVADEVLSPRADEVLSERADARPNFVGSHGEQVKGIPVNELDAMAVEIKTGYRKRYRIFLEKGCDIKWLEETSKDYHQNLYRRVIKKGGSRQTYYQLLNLGSSMWGNLEIRLLKLFTYKMRTSVGSWINKNYKKEALEYLLKLQEPLPVRDGFSLEKLRELWSGPNLAIFGPIELMQCTSTRFSQVGRCKSEKKRDLLTGYLRVRDHGVLPHGLWIEDRGWEQTLRSLSDYAMKEAQRELQELFAEIAVTKEPPGQKTKFKIWFNKIWNNEIMDKFQYQDEMINLFETLYYLNEVDHIGNPLFFSLFKNKMNLSWVIPIHPRDGVWYHSGKSIPQETDQEESQDATLGFKTWTDFFCTQGSPFHQRNTYIWFIESYKNLRKNRAVVLSLKK